MRVCNEEEQELNDVDETRFCGLLASWLGACTVLNHVSAWLSMIAAPTMVRYGTIVTYSNPPRPTLSYCEDQRCDDRMLCRHYLFVLPGRPYDIVHHHHVACGCHLNLPLSIVIGQRKKEPSMYSIVQRYRTIVFGMVQPATPS